MELHKLMVYVATAVLIIALLLYMYHPGDDVLVSVIATALGFLFGKASNGIGKYSPSTSYSDANGGEHDKN